MKVRIQAQSIRFRLNKSDIAELADTRTLSQQTFFASGKGQPLGYTLTWGESEDFSISFNGHEIRLNIPGSTAKRWLFRDEEVGFSHEFGTEGEMKLHLLVEKDFQCLAPRPHEHEDNNFPNPLSAR